LVAITAVRDLLLSAKDLSVAPFGNLALRGDQE
jgi:hypothetical protein